ncbi:Hypothetical protein SMAX5B_000030 [Scophthalmus maximus]|nr:Hypothetical protein SMAX5B_000030 [Scophthalmus maximus]
MSRGGRLHRVRLSKSGPVIRAAAQCFDVTITREKRSSDRITPPDRGNRKEHDTKVPDDVGFAAGTPVDFACL